MRQFILAVALLLVGLGAPASAQTSVTGTIVAVKGHLVTVQQSAGQTVVDDSMALRAQTTGRVAVGRQVTCSGFTQDGVFYATSIVTAVPVVQDSVVQLI